jgi:hypothetical protein
MTTLKLKRNSELSMELWERYFKFEWKRKLKKEPLIRICSALTLLFFISYFFTLHPILLLAAVISLGYVIYSAAHFFSRKRKYLNYIRKDRTDEYEFSYSENGVQYKTIETESILAWSHFGSYELNGSEIYLYDKTRGVIRDIISKQISGEEHFSKLKELIETHVSNRKTNQKKSEGAFNVFEPVNHLQPSFSKTKFDTLHLWELGWDLLEPLNKASGGEQEKQLAKRLSPGQKALYFFWYLDAEVTNGGFVQFYWNGKQKYVSPIKDGLRLIGDKEMEELVDKAEKEYLINKVHFENQKKKDDWSPLYDELKVFGEFDSLFYKIHDRTMDLIERYARKHPEEFVKFK